MGQLADSWQPLGLVLRERWLYKTSPHDWKWISDALVELPASSAAGPKPASANVDTSQRSVLLWRSTESRARSAWSTEPGVCSCFGAGLQPSRALSELSACAGSSRNGRGADMDGNYVYGNIFDVPYKMRRVSDEHWTVKGEGSEA